MKRKMKKFDEGGGVEEMKKGLFSSKEDKEQEDARSTYFKSPRPASRSTLPSAKEKTGTYGPSSSVEPANFKEAFAAARKAGNSSFTFDGKKFTTETAGAKKPTESVLRNAADEMAKGAASESRLSDSIRDDEARVKSNYMKNRDLPTVERARKLQNYAGKQSGNNMAVYGMAKGGSTASKRADGCAMRGKTRGRMV